MTLANDTNEALAADWGGADVGDYFALLKPRVMSLVVFTALVGMVVAPGTHQSGHRRDRPARHRRRRRGLRRAQHVVRRRHRPLMRRTRGGRSRRAARARRCARLRPHARRRLGRDPRPCRQLLAAGASRLHDLLLRRRLHDVAEAPDAAEHRHRRRRRRPAAGDRLGGGDRQRRLEPLVLFLIIFLWTPPHFWALALFKHDDYARGRRARCCRSSPATLDQAARS